MLTRIECPKDNQRLLDLRINEKDTLRLKPLSASVKEIEIKCPKCGGIVSIDLGSEALKVTMKTLGNTGRRQKKNRRRLHTEQRSH